MLCVEVASDGTVYVVDPQPSDFSTCALVLVSGDQSAPFQIPSNDQLAESFGFAFSLVMTCGVVGFLIGRLVNFWR